jgi:hypothetical protein
MDIGATVWAATDGSIAMQMAPVRSEANIDFMVGSDKELK